MGWLRTAAGELLGLFVDDASYALAIVAWILVAWLALPRLGLAGAWPAVIFVAGLALILVESTVRRAGAGRPR